MAARWWDDDRVEEMENPEWRRRWEDSDGETHVDTPRFDGRPLLEELGEFIETTMVEVENLKDFMVVKSETSSSHFVSGIHWREYNLSTRILWIGEENSHGAHLSCKKESVLLRDGMGNRCHPSEGEMDPSTRLLLRLHNGEMCLCSTGIDEIHYFSGILIKSVNFPSNKEQNWYELTKIDAEQTSASRRSGSSSSHSHYWADHSLKEHCLLP